MTRTELDAKYGKGGENLLNGTFFVPGYTTILVKEITLKNGEIVGAKGAQRYAVLEQERQGEKFTSLLCDSHNTPNWPYPEDVTD